MTTDNGFPSVTKIENPLSYSSGAEGRISFQPSGSSWSFSASFRYGRANGGRHIHPQKKVTGGAYPTYASALGRRNKSGFVTPTFVNYAEEKTDVSESHTIVDFQVGRDVGIGQFGKSTIGFGVRHVQDRATSDVSVYAKPDILFHVTRWNALPVLFQQYVVDFYHNSASTMSRVASFRGLGPSISLSNTTPLLGDEDDGQITLDWGANAAVLFGRQKVTGHHESTASYHYRSKHYTGAIRYKPVKVVSTSHSAVPLTRSRSVTVPNIGGFAGISYRFPNARLSVGYRADYFFGMLDGGVDLHHDINRSFNGPYATISIGLGG
jgi:hypothetical protein